MNTSFRIIDANLNRVAEGARVIEDLARFHFESAGHAEALKRFRHGVRKIFSDMNDRLVAFRDSAGDVGVAISGRSTLDRKADVRGLVFANFKRIEEGLRTIEEHLKIIGQYDRSKVIEGLRFGIYTSEKSFHRLFPHRLPAGIYGITAEKYSRGRSNIDVVRDMIRGGIRIIQYREKAHEKSLRQIHAECREIRELTRDHGVLFIVNDFVDIAMAVDADGVHVGQDDLPVSEVRQLVGEKMIGLSTHSPDQARRAIESGADYIGVGPVFETRTKENVCDPVGLEYLDYAVKNVPVPFVAIGGIKRHNIHRVSGRGARTICLVTEIVGAEDIVEKIKELREIMGRGSEATP